MFYCPLQTRLLVTHGIHWLPRVDHIVVMVGGVITENGSYDELIDHDGDFAQFLKQFLKLDEEEDDNEEGNKTKGNHLGGSLGFRYGLRVQELVSGFYLWIECALIFQLMHDVLHLQSGVRCSQIR